MKCKVFISTFVPDATATPFQIKGHIARSLIWEGEIEIPDNESLLKVTVIAEGHNEPIIEIPFQPFVGYYRWFPPEVDVENNT